MRQKRINRFQQLVRFYRLSALLFSTIWIIYKERKRILKERADGRMRETPNPEVLRQVAIRFRQTALKLEGLLIKLGQFLSSRADLLPQQALVELAVLQDEVTPVPFSSIAWLIESELGKPVDVAYAFIEHKAVAAASMGQVHRARLHSGEIVAVKVQRPYIQQLVRSDLGTIRFVCWVCSRFKDAANFVDLNGFYREFRRVVYEELDYIAEAHNSERFAKIFAGDSSVCVPKVHWNFTTQRLLTLEWIAGIKITDYTALENQGLDRKQIANQVVSTYFRQILGEGFFHADPHPGNIFIHAGPEGKPIITFIDFGMVGTITPAMRKSLKKMFLSVVEQDAHNMVISMDELGFLGPGANQASIEKAVAYILERYYNMTIEELSRMNPQEMFDDIEHLLFEQPFQLPYQFAFLGRAVGTLSGLATGLSPQFNFITVATPYAKNFVSDGARGFTSDVGREALTLGRALLTLPRLAERVLTKAEQGELRIKMEASGLENDLRRVEDTGNRLVSTLLFALSVAGGVVLQIEHRDVASWFCLGMAAVVMLLLTLRR